MTPTINGHFIGWYEYYDVSVYIYIYAETRFTELWDGYCTKASLRMALQFCGSSKTSFPACRLKGRRDHKSTGRKSSAKAGSSSSRRRSSMADVHHPKAQVHTRSDTVCRQMVFVWKLRLSGTRLKRIEKDRLLAVDLYVILLHSWFNPKWSNYW